MEGDPLGWPSGLGLGLPCWRSQVRNPLSAKAKGLPSESSSPHQACLVWVTSPMWFVSYCIGAEVLPCAHPKGSGCRFESQTWDFNLVWAWDFHVGGLKFKTPATKQGFVLQVELRRRLA
ncbi:hypothetical protein H5410_030438 [Solanum commersonii]|uniref:Uncharacterized protein n=1 Tax=Solanum commersonii TaxID=4109 RepID=A0A9J5YIP0_SOLCO|nr:hypothetical protein H5410_030438 [Solanum commersonii]